MQLLQQQVVEQRLLQQQVELLEPLAVLCKLLIS
jgi:hypothetical protein